MAFDFNPVRSLIFIRVAREEYRHKLRHWMQRYHIAESMAQFDPYVSKYAYYPALPVPSGGEKFGAHNFQLTEHYWLVSDFDPHVKNKTFTEYFPPDVLRWQGNIPDEDPSCRGQNMEGESARATNAVEKDDTLSPFIFAFVPVWWDEDLKGRGRTAEDGPNYRWMILIKYPEDVTEEAGEKWFHDEFLKPYLEDHLVTRILSSKVLQEQNNCPYHRCVEIWFEGPDEWERVVSHAAKITRKPAWTETAEYPYLRKYTGISCLFLGDTAESNNLTQYRGYYTMR
jgi:hypothetical protein